MKRTVGAIFCLAVLLVPAGTATALDMTSFNGIFPVGGSFFPAYEMLAGCAADFNFTNYLAVTAGIGAFFFLDGSSSGDPLVHPIAAGPFTADGSFYFIMIEVPIDLKFKSPCSDFYYFGGAAFALTVVAFGYTFSGMSLDLFPYINPFVITPRVGMGWRFGPRVRSQKMFAIELLVGYRVLTLVPEDALQRLSIKVALSMQVDMDTLPFNGSFDYE